LNRKIIIIKDISLGNIEMTTNFYHTESGESVH